MPHQMDSVMAHTAATLLGNAGFIVTITSGTDKATITAVPDEVTYESRSDGETVMSWVSKDWLVNWEDWNFGPGPVDPARGDTIAYTDPFGVTHEYTVTFMPNSPVFARQPFGHLMTVHTKKT